MSTSDRSIAEVLQDIVRNIQTIIRSEIRLAKTEITEEAGKAKTAGIMLGAGAVCSIFAAFFLLLAVVYALARVVPDWSAALIVTALMAIGGGVLLSGGVNKFKAVNPAPERAIESVKENVEWAKQQTK